MPPEIAMLKKHVQNVEEIIVNPFLTMYTGSLHGKDVVFASPGVGMVFAATTVTTMIDKYDIVGVIFTGVAGGLKPKTKVGRTALCCMHTTRQAPGARRQAPRAGRHALGVTVQQQLT